MSSAGHQVHGMGMALEDPTWPAITLAEAEAVLAAYPRAGRPAALQWHSPRPFSAACRIETETGATLFLKRHDLDLRNPAALAGEHAFMAHLREAGLPVPEVHATAQGTRALVQGSWTYELLAPAPGEDLYRDAQSWTPFFSRDHAFAAGEALARLHLSARSFPAPARRSCPLIASFTILPDRDPLAAASRFVTARPALAAYLADKPWQADLARRFAALGKGLAQDLARQAPIWTHNDWHPSNLLWSPQGQVAGIIDFGLATQTCALHDLATAIERSAIPWLDLASADPRANAADALALIAGYCAIQPLAEADLALLFRLLPLVHIEFALSETDYFAGLLGDRTQADMAWHGYALGHADWFASGSGQDFLNELASGAFRP